MTQTKRTRGDWSTKKRDDAPRGVFRHASGDWAIRFTCGGGHVHEQKIGRVKAAAKDAHAARRLRAREEPGWCPVAERRAARAAVVSAAAVEYPLLRNALPKWLDSQQRIGEIRASTARVYADRCRGWVYPHVLDDGRHLGDLPVDQVTREMLGAVIRRAREHRRSMGTVNQIRYPLRGFYEHMIESKTLEGPSPAADLKFFVGKRAQRKVRHRVVYFGQEEGPRLIATAKAVWPRWHPFILTGLLAGLRWGESAALRTSDIDWRRGSLTIERTVSDKGHRIEPVKDGEWRSVKTSPALLEALRGHVAAMALEGQVNCWSTEQRALVFPTSHGNVLRYPYFLDAVWRPLLAMAGLPYRRYHATRHSYATWLLSDGADLRWVQQQMGHATIGQTADTYGHVQPERHEAAVAGLDQYLNLDNTWTRAAVASELAEKINGGG